MTTLILAGGAYSSCSHWFAYEIVLLGGHSLWCTSNKNTIRGPPGSGFIPTFATSVINVAVTLVMLERMCAIEVMCLFSPFHRRVYSALSHTVNFRHGRVLSKGKKDY